MKVRRFSLEDVVFILDIYKRAFAGYPWHEDLTEEVLDERWINNSSQHGFECFVSEIEGTIVGSIWWDILDSKRLVEERGTGLYNFVQLNFPQKTIIWEREVIVDPFFQGRGVATVLRNFFVKEMRERINDVAILTRMRDDNFGIIKIAEKMGFKRTGIKIPCSLKAGMLHEYWFLADADIK